MMKAVEDETTLSTTDTKPTPSKSSKSSKSASSKKKKARAAKHRKSRRQSRSADVAPQAPAPTKKKSSKKDAKAVSPNTFCLGCGFFLQFLLCIGAIVGYIFSSIYMVESLQYAFLILLIAQLELLMLLLLASCIKALAWVTIVNHVAFFFVELGFAIYVTIVDMSKECRDDGCTCLHGKLLHRIVFVGTCVIFGGIHALLSCCISVGICLNKVEQEEANVEAQKSFQETKAVAVAPKLPQKTRWISESETQSRSSVSAKSRKRRSAAQKASLSGSSWSAASFPPPPPSSVSSYPTDSSQKLTSGTSSDYPYCKPQVTTASSCPYSAALVAQSKQVRPAFYPPPCPTPNPFVYGYGQQWRQQQAPVVVNASEDVTVNVTYPSVTSVSGAKEYASVTVRIPPAYPYQDYSQQPQQLPAQPQVSVQRHRPYPEPQYRPHKAQSVKTAKGFGNAPGSDYSSFNVSQTSEANSMVLPSSFASQDENAGQRIFTANTPSSKHY